MGYITKIQLAKVFPEWARDCCERRNTVSLLSHSTLSTFRELSVTGANEDHGRLISIGVHHADSSKTLHDILINTKILKFGLLGQRGTSQKILMRSQHDC